MIGRTGVDIKGESTTENNMTSLQFTSMVRHFFIPDSVHEGSETITAVEDERLIVLSYNKKNETFTLKIGNIYSLPQKTIEATLQNLHNHAVEQEQIYKTIQKTIQQIR